MTSIDETVLLTLKKDKLKDIRERKVYEVTETNKRNC